MAVTVVARSDSKRGIRRTGARRKTKDVRNVTVRLVKPSDAPDIATLSVVLGYPISLKAMAALIRKVSARKNQKLFVATVRGEVAGWLEIFHPLSVLNSGKAEIGALIVDEQYRRFGVGTALMDKAHEWARRTGSPFIYLRSNIIRKEAHEFYKRSGYSVFKTQYVFRNTLTRKEAKDR